MPRDDLGRRLRRALEGEPEVTATAVTPDEDVPANTPLRQLRYLAANGRNESVRLQASRLLLERDEARRARRRAAQDEASTEGVSELQRIVLKMNSAELAKNWDDFCGPQRVAAALAGDNTYPRFAAALRAEIAERAEARARELADSARIEATIEERAEALAEELYRARAFVVVPADDAAGVQLSTDETPRQCAPAAETADPARFPHGLTAEDLRRPWPVGRARRGHRRRV